jgi:hypothetical protein
MFCLCIERALRLGSNDPNPGMAAKAPRLFGRHAAVPTNEDRCRRSNRLHSQMLPFVRILLVIIGLLSVLPLNTASAGPIPAYRSSSSPGSPMDPSAGNSYSLIIRGGGGAEGGSVDQWNGVARQHTRPVMCLRGGSGAAASVLRPSVSTVGVRYTLLDDMLERNRRFLLAEHGGEAGVRSHPLEPYDGRLVLPSPSPHRPN